MTEPTKAVARYDGPRTIDELVRYSQVMADGASVLPRQFRNQPGSILFAVEYAKALDVSPVTAITGIHVIDGKPTASAGLISALIRRAGHTLRVKMTGTYSEQTLKATATLIRSDDPDEPYVSEWDIERAIRAKLLRRAEDGSVRAVKDGSAWDTYLESMLKARAVTEVGRDAAEDVLLGVHYTAEELGADVDASGEPVYVVTQVPEPGPATPPQTSSGPASRPDTPAAAPETPEPSPSPEELVEAARVRILTARTLDDLSAVWADEPIRKSSARAGAMVTADHDGVETNVLALFRLASAGIKAETPLLSDAEIASRGWDIVDAEIVGDANLADLERLLPRLKAEQPDAYDDVCHWATVNGVDLGTSDDGIASEIVEAIASGDALGMSWLETLSETPLELVTRLLGATPVAVVEPSEEDRARLAAAEAAEEARRDAEEAKPATRGSSSERRSAAAAEARRAAEAAKNPDQS